MRGRNSRLIADGQMALEMGRPHLRDWIFKTD